MLAELGARYADYLLMGIHVCMCICVYSMCLCVCVLCVLVWFCMYVVSGVCAPYVISSADHYFSFSVWI